MKRAVIFLTLAFLGFQAQAQETYLDLLLNYTPTKFNFGDDNSELKEFRESLWGISGRLEFSSGGYRTFFLSSRIVLFQ